MAPFKALYGYEALNFADLAFGDKRAPKENDWVQENQDIFRVVKENIQEAHNQHNLYVDRHRIERSFEVGILVYLRIQPYMQSSLKKKRGGKDKTSLLWSLQGSQEGWRDGL